VTAPSMAPAPGAGRPGHDWRGLDACVHCGFCLQACPTYLALGDENDSPRGRIVLMRALVEGVLPITDSDADTHIGRCLDCRACETACPSGVPYGALLEATRAMLREVRPIPRVARLILWVFSRPAWLALSLRLARLLRALRLPVLAAWLPGRAGFGAAMLGASARPRLANRRAYPTPAPGAATRGTVALLEGCVMRGLFAETNRATERVLAANDYAVTRVSGQRCCGALHVHAGDTEGARVLARANVDAFMRANPSVIATNAAGCGAMLRTYGSLLGDEPRHAAGAAAVAARARDVTELLADAGPRPGGAIRALEGVAVAYDPPCHLLHAQRVAAAPLAVLQAIPSLQLVPLADADQCCGGAGIYNLVHPALSGSVLTA
jgi:glycolate oxidase iron-sulfur subunit